MTETFTGEPFDISVEVDAAVEAAVAVASPADETVLMTEPPAAVSVAVTTASAVAGPVAGTFEEHLARGLEAALARSYERAARAFEKALELEPDDSRAAFNLARVRRLLADRNGRRP